MFPVDMDNHIGQIPSFPSTYPDQYVPKPDPKDVLFDPKIHLVTPLPVPSHIKILQSDENAGKGCVKLVTVPSDHPRTKNVEDLAYTEPFRVLTEEGVKVFREIISQNEDSMAIITPRNPKIIRGLGFTSNFVRAFNESPILLQHLSKFANVPICAHSMTTNYSQINFGEPPKEGHENAKPADVWHLDSVDYVLVVMLTDGFEGGELLVSNMDPNQAMEKIQRNQLPTELTTKNKYPKPGYGIFMQGCRIAHAVSPLTGGNARITAVNSYSSRNISRIDRPSIYNALSVNHTKEVYDPDYLRHIAVRCIWKLEDLAKNPSYGSPEKGKAVLDLVIEQLEKARSLMRGTENPDVPFSNEMKFAGDFYDRDVSTPSAKESSK